MDKISSNSASTAPIRQSASRPQTNSATVSSDATKTSSAPDATPKLSSGAVALDALFKSASQSIKDNHMEPFSGYVRGNVSAAAYIDVNMYNDYIFEKSATDMVKQAKDLGIELDKEDVIKQLKTENPEIASIRASDSDRVNKLGPTSTYAKLSASDLETLTKTYITAKENNLDLDQVDILAAKMGFQNMYGGVLAGGDEFDAAGDVTPLKPEIEKMAEEVSAKMKNNMGLNSDFVKFLLDPQQGLKWADKGNMDFLLKLAELQR